jgi:hypothetical protein
MTCSGPCFAAMRIRRDGRRLRLCQKTHFEYLSYIIAPGYRVNEMKRFVQGGSRTQSILLPECLNDYITETNPVRVINVFVDELDLGRLGFDGVEPAVTGRPSYRPEVMLKIHNLRLGESADS